MQGDTFDKIAYRVYGTGNVTTEIMNANLEHIGVGVFGAGVEIVIPEIDTSEKFAKPPWVEG